MFDVFIIFIKLLRDIASWHSVLSRAKHSKAESTYRIVLSNLVVHLLGFCDIKVTEIREAKFRYFVRFSVVLWASCFLRSWSLWFGVCNICFLWLLSLFVGPQPKNWFICAHCSGRPSLLLKHGGSHRWRLQAFHSHDSKGMRNVSACRLLAVPFWIVERAREKADDSSCSRFSRALLAIQKGTASSLEHMRHNR